MVASDHRDSLARCNAARVCPDVRIIGVDLAASIERTAAAIFTFAEGRLDLEILRGKAANIDDELLRKWLAGEYGQTVVGIDAPFGWPAPFASTVRDWMETGGGWPDWDLARKEGEPAWGQAADFLAFRVTDRYVRFWRRHDGRVCDTECAHDDREWPEGLSVSTNLLAVAAFRAARALQAARVSRRRGDGCAVEVYPAGALAEWGLRCQGYKSDAENREELAADFCEELRDGLVRFGRVVSVDASAAIAAVEDAAQGIMRRSHDALDAVVAAVVTWAALVGGTSSAPGLHQDADVGEFMRAERFRRSGIEGLDEHDVDLVDVIEREGWIHHPRWSIDKVLGHDPRGAVVDRARTSRGEST